MRARFFSNRFPAKKPLTGLWIGLGIGGLVMVLLCCGTGFVAFNARQSVSVGARSTSAPLPVERQLPEPDGKLGEPVRVRDLEFTVLGQPKCATGPRGTGALRATPKRGQFCEVPIRVVNRGSARVRWSTLGMYAYTERNPETKVFISADGTFAVPGEFGSADLPAGATWTGAGVFDLPAGDPIRFVEFTDMSLEETVVVEL